MNNVTFGDESMGYYETVAGGAGAVRRSDWLLRSHDGHVTFHRAQGGMAGVESTVT